ncbi:ParB/RepB/Spo0J family partition protein [candidate division GN15 bacterium]|nr:ParB/RepB/Spo0J family partition protein [candidate division GN15 bacterium]
MSKQVLGKGLSALIPGGDESSVNKVHFRAIDLDQIAPNPMQPRQAFADDRLQELAQSLKTNGVMQPLVVRKSGSGFTIVAGERRYRAARIAGLAQVPVIVVEDIDDTRMLELALVENIHRQDLNAVELAEAYRRLIDDCGLTQAELASHIGKSRVSITNHLRLLSLPDSIKRLVAEGRLTEGHARAILAIDNEAQQLEMADKIVSDALSVRDVEKAAKKKAKRRLVPKRSAPEVAEMENDLKRIMGTSVRVSSGLKKGKIEIEYYGHEDLDRLWQLFRKIDSQA